MPGGPRQGWAPGRWHAPCSGPAGRRGEVAAWSGVRAAPSGPVATGELDTARLVAPLPLRVPNRHHWLFACGAENRLNPKIKRFEDWLVRQIAADATLEPYREKGSDRDRQ